MQPSAEEGKVPRGDLVDETGLVLRDGHRTILRVDDGGEWDLDLLPRHGNLLGQRVRVQGRRAGFNLIDVHRVERA